MDSVLQVHIGDTVEEKLTKLNLSGNELIQLPPEIDKLTNIEVLNLAKNNFDI